MILRISYSYLYSLSVRLNPLDPSHRVERLRARQGKKIIFG
jgi:hypothetical protein